MLKYLKFKYEATSKILITIHFDIYLQNYMKLIQQQPQLQFIPY